MTETIYSPERTRRHSVAGLFPDRASAEGAIDELKAAGFTGDQIGVALRGRTAQGESIAGTATQAAEGATTGAVGGGLLGALTDFRRRGQFRKIEVLRSAHRGFPFMTIPYQLR